MLSAQAEVGLAVLIRGGADRIAREPSEAELKGLGPDDLRIRARDCLVLHNQRLVYFLVRPYLEQGLDYDDLVQHGFLGLLRATRKFDPSKGFKFSTYATWWIRQSITPVADRGALRGRRRLRHPGRVVRGHRHRRLAAPRQAADRLPRLADRLGVTGCYAAPTTANDRFDIADAPGAPYTAARPVPQRGRWRR
ncbi:sigma-70 family RNA polymerase sigma factor [Streptomyces sp. NPDC000851]